MANRWFIVITLLSACKISAYSQIRDQSYWIIVDDHQGNSVVMEWGDKQDASYYIDDGNNGTTNYYESSAPPPPPDPAFDARWKGIPGRNNAPIVDGLFPRDYQSFPTNAAGKDTFLLKFYNSGVSDSAMYFSWPDVSYLSLRCDSIIFQYEDPDSTPTTIQVSMMTDRSWTIPSAGKRNIIQAFIYKFGLKIGDAVENKTTAPYKFVLRQAFPNPFNAQTNISYSISSHIPVKMQIFDILGREIAILVNENKSPGEYSVAWNAADVASGIYFYTITAGSFTQTKQMQLVR